MVFSFEEAAIAAPIYTSIKTGDVISAQDLSSALKQSGIIVTLSEGDSLSQNGLDITADSDSKIYLTNNQGNISTAVLDGIIQNTQAKKIESGEVFVHNIQSQKTEIYEFDTQHFLDKTGLDLSPSTQNKLNKIAKTQEKKKFFGILESDENNLNITPSALDTVIASLENQNIAEVRINDATFNLADVRELVNQGLLPLHILITWGAGASDLDIHLTGPNGDERFHVFYLNKGSLEDGPKAAIIDDCISSNCSEVIRVEELKKGGVYRASVFNFGDSRSTSDNLSSNSEVEIELIRGGTLVQIEGDTDLGSQISGGETLFKGSPTAGLIGNTWKAIEINPDNNNVTFINEITNSTNSRAVE